MLGELHRDCKIIGGANNFPALQKLTTGGRVQIKILRRSKALICELMGVQYLANINLLGELNCVSLYITINLTFLLGELMGELIIGKLREL